MIRTCALLVVVLLLASRTTVAQEERRAQVTIPYDGSEIFARLLDHAGLTPLKDFADLEDKNPKDVVVIVFGNLQPLVNWKRSGRDLEKLVVDGASLCVASDRPVTFNSVISTWKLTIRGNVLVHDDPAFQFQKNRRCPLILPNQRKSHPIFKNLTGSIATNCPSEILVYNPHFIDGTLAYLPVGTKSEPPDPLRGFDHLQRRIMIGTDATARERILVIAGHGLFMNCMTIRDDLDNRRFAFNVIDWLAGEGKARRKYALFVHEGQVQTEFKLPLIGPINMPMPSVAAMNRIIDAVEKEGLLQKFLEETIGAEAIVRGIIVFVTLALMLYGLKKLFQNRHITERTPLIIGIPEPHRTSLVPQQINELARRGQLGEPAQALARAWLRDVAGVEVSPGRPIEHEVRAGFFTRRKLRQQIDTVCRLATSLPEAGWTSARLYEHKQTLDELTVAVRRGLLIFPTAVEHP